MKVLKVLNIEIPDETLPKKDNVHRMMWTAQLTPEQDQALKEKIFGCADISPKESGE